MTGLSVGCGLYILMPCFAVVLVLCMLEAGLLYIWMIKCNHLSALMSPGKRCMGLVDLDRSWGAEKHGYSVRVMTMEPESCSPKNNMLVGRPPHRSGSSQLETLVNN